MAVYIADTAACRSVELEGLTLLFHPRSGMTHILAPPSPQILGVLEQAGDVGAVLARLRALYDLPESETEAALAARIAELEAIGLVRPA